MRMRGATRLSDVALVLTGLVRTRAQSEIESAVEAPIVALRDIDDSITPLANLERVRIAPSFATRFAIAAGDVVVTARGALVRTAVVGVEHAGVMLGPNLLCIRPDQDRLVAPLLAAYLRLPDVQAVLLSASAGTAMPSLTVKDLSRLKLFLPPLDEQHDLVVILDLAARHRAALLQAINLRDRIFGQLLNGAFGSAGAPRRE